MTTPRFPRFCTRCSSRDHYVEECKRMPALGMTPQERDMMRKVAYDRSAVLWAAVAFIAAMIVVTKLGE